MTLSLRPYQRAAIDALYDYFGGATGNPLVVMPTGTGKSVVIGGFIREAIAAYADAIHPWRDGRSSERVIDATEALLVRGLDSLARKPLGAWWRALQIRRELGYLRP